MNRSAADVLASYADLPAFARSTDDVNAIGTWGNRPIHVAAVHGDVEALCVLLDAGADISAQGEHGYTALHEAAEQGHTDAVRLLVERGAQVAAKNDDGDTARDIALLLGHDDIAVMI